MKSVKTFGEFIGEAATVSGFDYEEAKRDLEELDSAYTKAEKKAVADKYGIESNKMAEIKKEIYLIGNEARKAKNPADYTDEDFIWWWRCFDGPTTSVTLKKALEDEALPWLEFILKKAEELIFKGSRSDYWERARRSFNKYVTGLINRDRNSKDRRYLNLISLLMEETKDFHDKYIDSVRDWAGRRFDTYKQFKGFDIYDFMCFFGTQNRDSVATIYERKDNPRSGQFEVYRRIDKIGKYFSPVSTEYTPKVKTITSFSGNIVTAVPIRKQVEDYLTPWRRGDNMYDRSQYSDLPSEQAVRTCTETQMLGASCGWNKRKYIDEEVDAAERQYKRDMEKIAERIRNMNMEEENISVQSIFPDPKHYDITVTDGKRTAHARSIFAAEYSVKVTPHYRFIIT